eukprot:scaffold81982_cov31-Tisochrysis_lutea.AAC.3
MWPRPTLAPHEKFTSRYELLKLLQSKCIRCKRRASNSLEFNLQINGALLYKYELFRHYARVAPNDEHGGASTED